MHKKYYGVIPPVVTPITEKETVDEAGFRKLLEYCIDGGLHGIFVAGSNGETMALTQGERNRAIQIAIDQVNGRVPVMCGVMDTSTQRVIDNIKVVEQMGGQCAVVTPVFYDRHTSQDETVRHFERILRETSIDLMIYNIPLFTGIKLTGATMLKIAALDRRVAGCKDSSGSFADFASVLETCRDTPFSILQGATPLAMASLLMGADGFVPSMAPVFPRLFAKAYEAGISLDCRETWKYNQLIRETSKVLGMTKNATAAAKYAISLRGLIRKDVIMPQDSILAAEEESIRQAVAEIDRMIVDAGI